MPNEKTSTYYDACQYAIHALGAETAQPYFSRLRQLSHYAPLEDLYILIDSWRPSIPKIVLSEPPAPKPWTPCKHFGGDRECETCRRKSDIAGLALEQVEQINESLKVGAAFRVPAHLRHRKFLGYSKTGREKYSETQLVDEAVQSGWVKMLEDGVATVEDKQANIVGQTVGRDVVREERKYVSLPETRENEDGEMTSVAPWDVIDSSDRYRLDPLLEQIFGEGHTEEQEGILQQFCKDSSDDFGFLMNYLAARRKEGRFTRKERNRVGAIIKKLRRRAVKAAKVADSESVGKNVS